MTQKYKILLNLYYKFELVTPTDRPKSVRNRSVIKVFGGVCVLSFDFRILLAKGGFVIWLGQISFFFFL